MKLILHCGTSKTGTTSLQDCLNASQSQLAAAGVLYPDPMFGLNSHLAMIPRFKAGERVSKRLAQAFGGQDEAVAKGQVFFDAFRERVLDLRPEVIVLSCEYLFQSLDLGQLRAMTGVLQDMGCTVQPVVYLREPASWYASSCQQNIKMGRPLKAPGAQEIRAPLEALAAGVGPVMMRKFARDALEGGDIVTDFMTHVVQRPDLLPGLQRSERNVSLSAEACAIVQAYRTHAAPEAAGLSHQGTRKLINKIAEIEAGERVSVVLRPEVAQVVRRASVDYVWLREVHGLGFAECERDGEGGDVPAVEPRVEPRVETLFAFDPMRKDRIIARLLDEAIVGKADREKVGRQKAGREKAGRAGRKGKARARRRG